MFTFNYVAIFHRFRDIITYFSKNSKRSSDSEHIPFVVIYHACTCIKQHKKCEVPSFINSKDMIGAKLKQTSHVTLTTPIRRSVFHIFYLLTTFNLLLLPFWRYDCRHRNVASDGEDWTSSGRQAGSAVFAIAQLAAIFTWSADRWNEYRGRSAERRNAEQA